MKRFILLFFLAFAHHFATAQTFIELNNEFLELFKKEDYSNAVIVGEKAVAKAKLEYGTKHMNYAVGLHNLAEGYFNLQNWAKALPNYRLASSVFTIANKTSDVSEIALINNSIGTIYFVQEQLDSASLYFTRSLNYFYKHQQGNYSSLYFVSKNLADTYFKQDDFSRILATSERMLPVILKEKGKENEEYYAMLYNKGHALHYLQKYAEAETAFTGSLSLAEKLYGKENAEYAAVLSMLFRTAKEQNKFALAEQHLINSIKALEASPVMDTLTVAIYYKAGGDFYSDYGHFKISEDFYSTALSLLLQSGAANSIEYYSILQSRAYAYIQAGRLLEAKKILNDLLAIYNVPTNGLNTTTAELLIVTANAEAQLNELDAAEQHSNEGIEMINKLYPAGNALLVSATEVLGMAHYKKGENNKSITAYKKALELTGKYYGENSRQASSLLSNLGITHQVMGDYALAETALKKSLQIRGKLLGTDHPDYALSLINMGMISVMQSRYAEADKMLAEAINIYVKHDMLGTTNFISLLNNVALMEQRKGQLEVSKNLYFRLLQIMQEKKEANTEPLLLVYNNLGGLYMLEKKYDSAIIYTSNSLKLLEDANKIKSTEFIKSANTLMIAYKGKEDYLTANKIAGKLLPLCIEVMGTNAELLGIIYSNVAMLELVQNNKEKAAEYLQKGNAILLNHFKRNFYVLSEKEKLEWWDKQSFLFNLFPSLLMQYNITEGPQVEAMTDQQLQLKGFVLQDASSNLRKARASASPQMLKLLNQWQSNKTLLNKLYALPAPQRVYSVDSLEQATNELEKRVNQTASNTVSSTGLDVNWKSVRSVLNQDEAAIEFVQFPFYRNGEYTDTIQFAAIIIRKDFASPKFVLLASEKRIAQYFTNTTAGQKEVAINKLYRSSLSKKDNTNAFIGDSLYQAIWQPLMPYLHAVKKISFAPDGILHKLAFHALPVTNTTILIDTFQLQQYSGIRQLAEPGASGTGKWNAAWLAGNVDFNTADLNNGKSIQFTSSKSGEWPALPGTANEVESLKQLFATRGIKTTVTSATKATEESFKKLNNQSPGIIHLATHGFFLRQKKEDTTRAHSLAGEQTFSNAENPLLRSGIVLAGANKAWSGERMTGDTDDGIVTAYEISQLNLSGTSLVVLSACETALGDVQGTEGVFGLQRAFKIAGVKNMIVSLWQVPDKETAALMTLFYTNLLNNDPVREAFYKAQKTMREKHPPYLWAAFVLIE